MKGGGLADLDGCFCIGCLRLVQSYYFACILTFSSLICATAGERLDVVDLYNASTGAWSTARLSVARMSLAAASVGNVALFAGGVQGVLLCREGTA